MGIGLEQTPYIYPKKCCPHLPFCEKCHEIYFFKVFPKIFWHKDTKRTQSLTKWRMRKSHLQLYFILGRYSNKNVQATTPTLTLRVKELSNKALTRSDILSHLQAFLYDGCVSDSSYLYYRVKWNGLGCKYSMILQPGCW